MIADETADHAQKQIRDQPDAGRYESNVLTYLSDALGIAIPIYYLPSWLCSDIAKGEPGPHSQIPHIPNRLSDDKCDREIHIRGFGR